MLKLKRYEEGRRIYFVKMNNKLPEKDQIGCVTSVFAIFFEDPFWVGILEEILDKEEKYKKKLEKKLEKKKGH